MQAKSNKAVFEIAANKLTGFGYEVDLDAKVTNYKDPVKSYGENTTWKQLPIKGTEGFLVVRYNKVAGMAGEYDAVVVREDRAIGMRLTSMTQPARDTYDTLLK